MKRGRECFISVGEHSGDLLASDLVLSLKDRFSKISFFGMTGDALQSAGVESIGSIDELSVMGFVEVLKKLPDLLALEKRILAAVDRRQPEFAILVDFPGFHFRLAEQLKLRGVKVIQYVAPKVWAWGEGRVAKLRKDFDLVLGIFPFEAGYFAEKGVNFRYIGSPHKDRMNKVIVKREDLGLASNL